MTTAAEPSSNRPLALVLAAILLAQFAQNCASLGSIVHMATEASGIQGTAVIVGIQALASLLAMGISNFANRKGFPRKKILAVVPVLWAVAAMVMVFLEPGQVAWSSALLARTVAATWIISFLLSTIPLFAANDILNANKRGQFFSIMGVMLGCAIGPVLVTYTGMSFLFLGDLIFAAAIFVLGTMIPFPEEEKKNSGHAAAPTLWSSISEMKPLLWIFYISFAVWAISGIFQIVEVPILNKRFQATSSMISMVFFGTLLVNFLTIKLTPVQWLTRNLKLIFGLSALALIIVSNLYLTAGIWTTVIFCIVVIGFTNGLFNLTQSSHIQLLSSQNTRLQSFLLIRVVTQCALMIGVLLAFYVPETHLTTAVAALSLVLCSPLVWPFIIKRRALAKQVIGLLIVVGGLLVASLEVVRAQTSSIATFKVPVQTIPEELNPAKILDGGAALIQGQIFDNLYEATPDNSIKPNLAKSHVLEKNSMSLRITVDKTKIFSDGTPLTAKIAADSLIQTIRVMGKESAWAFGEVEGFNEFVKSPTANAKTLGIRVLSDEQFEIKFSRPFALLPQILTAANFMIYYKKGANFLGTGAYVVDKHEKKSVVLKVRPDIAKLESLNPLAPQSIEFTESPGVEDTLKVLKEKNFDLVPFSPTDKNLPAGYEAVPYNYLQAVVLAFNLKSAQFPTSKSRCEFARAFFNANKEAGYKWQPISVGLPFSWEFFRPEASTPAISKANQKAPIRMLFADSMAAFSTDVNKAIVAGLLKHGLQANLERAPIGKLVKGLRNSEIDAAMFGFVPDYVHPDALLTPFLGTGQQYNLNRYSNKKLDKLLVEARGTQDRQQQLALYKESFQIIGQDCPVTFIGASRGIAVKKEGVILPEFPQLGFSRLKIKMVQVPKR